MDETWKVGEPTKEGDTVLITFPFWVKRRWWQFWKPRYVPGPIETRAYTAGAWVSSAISSEPSPK